MAEEITPEESKPETTEPENTDSISGTLEEELKTFMSDMQGQIQNLTQAVEKLSTVADAEPEPEQEPEPEPEKEPETDDTEKQADELLNDI